MPIITFLKTYKPIEVPAGTNLRQALIDHGVAVASSCGGEGVCGKCSVIVIEGPLNLTPKTELERSLQQRNHLVNSRRISCLLEVMGDIVLDNSYW